LARSVIDDDKDCLFVCAILAACLFDRGAEAETGPKRTLRQHKDSLYVGAANVSTGWAPGCLYLAAYAAWAWTFRIAIDPRARRALGRWMGVEIGWVRATTFPLDISVWGLVGRSQDRDETLLGWQVTLASVAVCLAGAFLPTAALCVLLRCRPWPSDELGAALYLITPVLILLFSASHFGWREPQERRCPGRKRVGTPFVGTGHPPSEPPARLDTTRES
jgi:hypothetical protein